MPRRKKTASAKTPTTRDRDVERTHEQFQTDLTKAFERGVCMQVTVGSTAMRRKVDSSKIDVKDASGDTDDVDKSLLYFSKEIIKSDEYDALRGVYGKIKKYLGLVAIPTPLMKSLYMIPLESLDAVDARLLAFQDEQRAATETFLKVYAKQKAEAKVALASLYDEDDYPSPDRIREAFYVKVRYIELNVPQKLRGISTQLFKREQEKLQKSFNDAAHEMRDLLRHTLHELVSHLAERLSGSDDGKPKVFRESAVGNLTEFLEHFAPRDVTSDAQLAEYVEKLQKLMTGVDVKGLREDEAHRKQLAQDLTKVKAGLDHLVVDVPSRRVKLGAAKKEAK